MDESDEASRIVKEVVLDASLERVWRAITDSGRFGQWFGAEVDGEFAAGRRVGARIRPTRVDPGIAEQQQAFDGLPFTLAVERIEPMRLFSFRWHPGGTEVPADTPDDQMTLVEFELEEVAKGVRLTITESGFERVPQPRRAQAIEGNTGGWEAQTGLIAKYLAQPRS